MSRSFKLTIAYDGTDFAGWQVQPEQRTVQQTIEQALHKITNEQIRVIGSGRTDSGVHALAQVASCTLSHWRDSAMHLARALNTQLPETVVVRQASDAPDGFHAIRDAVAKRYRYQLQLGGVRDAFEYRYRWHLPYLLNVEVMREAASRFLGRHDFASFQAAGASVKRTTVRQIHACDLIHQQAAPDMFHLAIEVEADGFLYNMVRNMVGTLIEVGREKKSPAWIDELIHARDRRLAGQTAPPQGLFLVRVDYENIGAEGESESGVNQDASR